MEKKIIYTEKAPEPVGPYSQGYTAGGFLFASGQIGINPANGKLKEGILAQTHQAISNLREVLKASGMDFSSVIKTTVFIKNMADFASVNEIYASYFVSEPARSCVEVSSLPKGALIEIECIAAR